MASGLGISCSMAAMSSHVAVVVVDVGHTRLQSMPLAMLTVREELHGFLFLYTHVGVFP